MSDKAYFLRLAQNNAWANATLAKAVVTLPADAFTAPRPGFFPSLMLTLNHIYEVDLFYVDALESGGLGRSVYEREDVRDATHLAALQAAVDARLVRFCNGLTQDTLSEMRTTARAHGPVKERTDWLLLHLFQHQIHHRGQAHAMLSHAGATPPQLDDFFLEDGRVASARSYWT